MRKSLCSCVIVWVACGTLRSAEYTVRVEAGPTHRAHTPVFVSVPLPDGEGPLAAEVIHDGAAAPAQVVADSSDGKRAEVWWIVSDLPAGASRTYTLRISSAGKTPAESFAWRDSSKGDRKSTDLVLGSRPMLRYMHTPFDPDNIELTKKPFHHVFSPDGSQLITKGAGGKYSHHRGIFFGYNKCGVGGPTYDVWHGAKGEHQQHIKVVGEATGPVFGAHTVAIDWNDRAGKPFAREVRTLRAYRQSAGRVLIEFDSMLTAVRGPVTLDGDRQHAGAQFRAAQEVADNETATRYLRPAAWSSRPADAEINTPEHKDLPWNAIQYSLGGEPFTVACLSDPKNPDGAEFSERRYGRFGEFVRHNLTKDNPLHLRYRWWIAETHDVTRQTIQGRYEDLASPPKVTVEK